MVANPNWQTKRLGDLADFRNGVNYDKNSFGNGVKVVGVSNFKDYLKPKYNELEQINPDGIVTARNILRDGDIVFVRSNGNRELIGRSLFIEKPQEEVTHSAFTIRLRFTSTEVYPKFYAYCFRTPLIRQALTAQGGGTNINNLNQDILSALEVPLPPLSVQQRIGGILEAYDDLIENSQRRIQILESMARTLYREWFVLFRFPGHESAPRIASPIGEIPQGWEAIPFENLLASMTGGDWGSEHPADRDTAEVAIVRGMDLDDVAYGGQLRVPVRYVKPSSLITRGLRAGDVVIENSINAKSRCIGTTLLVDNHVLNRLGRDAVAASFCKVFRMREPRLAPLVHLHVRHLREDARMEYYQNVAANGIGNFQAQKFAKEEHLVLPTDEAIRVKLIEHFSVLFQMVGTLSSQIANLRRTRDLLLPRLMADQNILPG